MKAQKGNELVRVGEQVQNMAMERAIESEDEKDRGKNSSSDRKCEKSKRVKAFVMNDKLKVMIEKARSCREVNRKRVRLDERQTEMEVGREKCINASEEGRTSLEK